MRPEVSLQDHSTQIKAFLVLHRWLLHAVIPILYHRAVVPLKDFVDAGAAIACI